MYFCNLRGIGEPPLRQTRIIINNLTHRIYEQTGFYVDDGVSDAGGSMGE